MLAARFQDIGTFFLLAAVSFAAGDIDLKCNFSTKQCDWTGIKVGFFWMEPKANSLDLRDLPLGISVNSLGAYLAGNLPASMMTSPLVGPMPSSESCFTFYYYLVIDQVEKSGLNLSIVDEHGNSTEIWYSGGVNADQWKKAAVTVQRQSQRFSLRFRAFIGGPYQGFSAVQSPGHFALTSGACTGESIDFESGAGGFTTVPTDWNKLQFIVRSARSTGGRIAADHTSRSPNGHFAYLEAPTSFKKHVDFMSGRLPAIGLQCFSFYFLHTAGNGPTQLHLDLYETHRNRVDGAKIERLLWSQNSVAIHWAGEWIRVQQTISLIYPESRITFRVSKSGAGSESLALDDINFLPFACDPPISCSFTAGTTCNWVDETRNNILFWSFGNGRVINPGKIKPLKELILLPGQNMLYTDFTDASQGGSMEMLSEFVQTNGSTSGACFTVHYRVAGFDQQKGSSFEVAMVDYKMVRTVLWSFGSSNATVGSGNQSQAALISVPNKAPGQSLTFRLSIRARSLLPSLFIGIERLDYSDKGVCSSSTAGTTVTSKPITTTTESPAKTLDCNFEQSNFCNWKPNKVDSNGNNAFSVGQSSDQLLKEHFLAPSGDHTKLSPAGHFAYVISKDNGGAASTQSSGTLRAVTPFTEACFTFYYFFNTFGLSNFTLQLEKPGAGERTIVYYSSGSNSFRWQKVSLTIAPSYAYSAFLFSATVLKGILAVDDISVVAGKCSDNSQAEFGCDYEANSTCGLLDPVWSPSSVAWSIYQGADIRPKKIADHTTRTPSGHFFGLDLSVLANGTSARQTEFRIQSRPIRKRNFHCLKFSYLLADVSPNVTFYYEVPVEGTNTHFELAGSTAGIWFRRHQRITTTTTQNTVTMGIKTGGEPKGKVFIDDLVFESWSGCFDGFKCDFDFGYPCNLQTVQQDVTPLNSFDARFIATHFYGYHQPMYYLTDYVDTTWIVYSPAISKRFVLRDNTLNSDYGGYFLLTGTTGAYNRGIFITDRYSVGTTEDRSVCVSFALYKPDNGAILEVYQGESMEETFGVKLWSRLAKSTPGSSSSWETIQIQATPQKSQSVDIYFFFVGTIENRSSYIAVDDLVISKTEECHHLVNPLATTPKTSLTTGMTTALPKGFFRCQASGKVLPNSARCNWVKDCLPEGEDEHNCGSCTFINHDLCGYSKSSTLESYYSYLFSDQSKAGPNWGPTMTAGRNYLIASGDWAATAFLESPLIQGSYSLCSFSFYYYFNESNQHDPNHPQKAFTQVELKYPDQSNSITVWHSKFEASVTPNFWHKRTIWLGRVPRPFRLWITSTEYYHKGVQFQAIGQLEMGELCGRPSKVQDRCLPSQGYFQCANKGCILATLVCNFENNCGDGSDEDARICDQKKMTSFENGYGRWGETLKSGWAIHGASRNLLDSPTFDHTTSFDGGNYLFAKADYLGRKKTVNAEISGPPLQLSSSNNCQISFFKMCNSENASLLIVSEDALTNERTVIRPIDSVEQQFTYQSISLGTRENLKNPFRIVILAVFKLNSNMWNNPWCAVDDISFSSGCIILDSVPPVTLPGGVTVTTAKPSNCSTVFCLSKANHGQTICLKVGQLCDLVTDCLNGEDERRCAACDFDHGDMCGWENRPAKSSWRLTKVAKDSRDKLPKIDADGNPLGGFIWHDSPFYSEDAIMRSARINSATSPYCKLEYSFMAPAGTKFRMLRISSLNTVQLLHSSSPFADGWTTTRIDLGEQAAGFNLQIESKTWTKQSFVAVDNIKMLECAPDSVPPTTPKTPVDVPKAVSCSFENDLCGWAVTSPSGLRSNWARMANSTTVEPGTDHTCLQKPRPKSCGEWLTTQAKADDHREVDYIKTTVQLKANTTYCFSFWYYFYAVSGSNELGLYLTNDGKLLADADYLKSLWTIKKPRAKKWLFQHVEISSPSAFNLYYMAKASRSAVIGLDDFNLTSGSCPTSPYSCDFEEKCDWTGVSGWTVATKQLDHTTNTWQGHFLVDNAGVGAKAVMSKALATVPFYANNQNWILENFCLKFFYRFSVEGFGIQNDNTSMIQVTVHHQSVNRGGDEGLNLTILDAFNDGRMNLWTPLMYSFLGNPKATVTIGGLVGSRSNGNTFIHIDDITLKPERCQVEGNCDFENNMCGWLSPDINGSATYLDWIIISPHSGFTSGEHMGYDHTSLTIFGNYLLLPVQAERTFTSYLQSDIFHRRSEHICFSMYYFARGNGSNVEAMKLYLIDLTHADASISHPVVINASSSAKQQLNWVKFEHEYRHIGRVFQFAISAQSNSQLLSDVGIDDIKVTNSPCYQGGVTPSPTPVPAAQKVLDDDFDSNAHSNNWSYDKSTWNVTSFSSGSNANAPRIDHTYESVKGKYLLLTLSPNYTSQTPPDFALKSTVTLSSTDDHCLYFWYYEDGEGAFSLEVDTQKVNTSTSMSQAYVYQSTIESRARWNPVKAFISAEMTTQQQISLSIHYRPTVARLAHYHVFALDDISVRKGVCSHRFDYTYTFTDGFEDLNVEYLQPLSTGIGRVVSPATLKTPSSTMKLPATDHTTNSPNGEYFLFANVNGSDPATTYIDTLAMMNIPPAQSENNWLCLRFAYQLAGNATLNVRSMPVDSYQYIAFPPFWLASGNTYAANTWTVAEANINGAYNRKMVFYMEKQFDRGSFIALDDLSVIDHMCPMAIDCDFDDQRMCAYSPFNSTTDGNQVNFGLMTAPAADPSWPGPMYDINRSWGGGYLYLTSFRSPSFSPITSRIISGARVLDSFSPAPYCLSLYVALPSSDASLKLTLRRYGKGWTEGNRLLQVLTITGNSSTLKDWTRQAVTVDINALLGVYEVQLIIEGSIAAHSKSAIAIDGIAFKQGVCQTEGIDCENGVHVPQSAICNFVKDCPSGFDELNCGDTNFEPPTGAAGWRNMSTYRGQWLLTSAREARSVHLNFNAPRVDADGKNGGHYLLMGGNDAALNDADDDEASTSAEAALNPNAISMHLKGAYKSCVMRFDYYLRTPASFNGRMGLIEVRIGEDAASWNTVYRIRHANGVSGWTRAYAHLGLHYTAFMVDLLGRLEPAGGTAQLSGVAAVDNVHFLNCTFPESLPKNSSTCPNDRPFLCVRRRFCISEDEVCSYVDECGDGQDERNCLPSQFVCNFEYRLGSCGISTFSGNLWRIVSGESVSEESSLPRIDNTKRSRTGHFFALEPPVTWNKQVRVRSSSFSLPPITTTKAGCRLRFYFFINGPPATVGSNKLQVFVQYAQNKAHETRPLAELHLNASADLQQRWMSAVVHFTSAERSFQFVFTGQLADRSTSMAVDDLTYSTDCLPVKVIRQSTTTTKQPPVTGSGQPSTGTTAVIPEKRHQKPGDSSKATKIAVGIVVPITLLACLAIGYYFFRRYQASKQTSENVVLSMTQLQDQHED